MLRDISFQLDVKRNRTREVPSSTWTWTCQVPALLTALAIHSPGLSLLVDCCVPLSGLPHAVRDAEMRTTPPQATAGTVACPRIHRGSASLSITRFIMSQAPSRSKEPELFTPFMYVLPPVAVFYPTIPSMHFSRRCEAGGALWAC